MGLPFESHKQAPVVLKVSNSSCKDVLDSIRNHSGLGRDYSESPAGNFTNNHLGAKAFSKMRGHFSL